MHILKLRRDGVISQLVPTPIHCLVTEAWICKQLARYCDSAYIL